ncbi:MAG: hypothetical protein Q4D13_01120 [Erysipelotrichaceae bacterium]|nr:hypothetical protein [Erysipelotrichaceae bacterium]
MNTDIKASFHLPGLFEFYDLYKIFLSVYAEHREYFYDHIEIESIYGSPAGSIWSGGRVGYGEDDIEDCLKLMKEYHLSSCLTFSNSLIKDEHLSDKLCNHLCSVLNEEKGNGVIVSSDLLKEYIKEKYPNLYLVSSTTKVLTDFKDLKRELDNEDYLYVVPDFRLNKSFEKLESLSNEEKEKVSFLVNECCHIDCNVRKQCYENVSRKALDIECEDHVCPNKDTYRFSDAMNNKMFISNEDIVNTYLPMGFRHFKIEGRSLGSAVVLEMLMYYLIKPGYHLLLREMIYLDSSLDLF